RQGQDQRKIGLAGAGRGHRSARCRFALPYPLTPPRERKPALHVENVSLWQCPGRPVPLWNFQPAKKDDSMANEGYHEPLDKLSSDTMEMHRAIVSLMEELEAVAWYNQRVDAATDPELKAI